MITVFARRLDHFAGFVMRRLIFLSFFTRVKQRSNIVIIMYFQISSEKEIFWKQGNQPGYELTRFCFIESVHERNPAHVPSRSFGGIVFCFFFLNNRE